MFKISIIWYRLVAELQKRLGPSRKLVLFTLDVRRLIIPTDNQIFFFPFTLISIVEVHMQHAC